MVKTTNQITIILTIIISWLAIIPLIISSDLLIIIDLYILINYIIIYLFQTLDG